MHMRQSLRWIFGLGVVLATQACSDSSVSDGDVGNCPSGTTLVNGACVASSPTPSPSGVIDIVALPTLTNSPAPCSGGATSASSGKCLPSLQSPSPSKSPSPGQSSSPTGKPTSNGSSPTPTTTGATTPTPGPNTPTPSSTPVANVENCSNGTAQIPVGYEAKVAKVCITGQLTAEVNVPYSTYFYAQYLNAGSAVDRGRVYARFCADAACANPKFVMPVILQDEKPLNDADKNKFSSCGQGKYGPVYCADRADQELKPAENAHYVIRYAPKGAYYVQLFLDTAWSNGTSTGVNVLNDAPYGPCNAGGIIDDANTLSACPGDFDVLETEQPPQLNNGIWGGVVSARPAASVLNADAPWTLDTGFAKDFTAAPVISLGHLMTKPIDTARTTPASENGKLWVAMSADSSGTLAVTCPVPATDPAQLTASPPKCSVQSGKAEGYDDAPKHASGAYRNKIVAVDLSTPIDGGYQKKTEMILQNGANEFQGDVCGFVTGADTIYALSVGQNGGYIHAFSKTGSMLYNGVARVIVHPALTSPTDAAAAQPNQYPRPCRGVYVEKGGNKYLYIVDFKGVGIEGVPGDAALYVVRVNATDFTDTNATKNITKVYVEPTATDPNKVTSLPVQTRVWRSLAVDAAKSALYLLDASYSKANVDAGATEQYNRLVKLPIAATGDLALLGLAVNSTKTLSTAAVQTAQVLLFANLKNVTSVMKKTAFASETQSGLSNGACKNYPSSLEMITAGAAGKEWLAMGYNNGVAFFDPANLSAAPNDSGNIATTYGVQFSQLIPSLDHHTLYAVPSCKAPDAGAFKIPPPKGPASAVGVDRMGAAILDLTKDQPWVNFVKPYKIAGEDFGVELRYFWLKKYLLDHLSTSASGALPNIVYTGLQVTLGEKTMFLRGTGIQGNSLDTISSSGLGQLQDVAVFSLEHGEGLMLNHYTPFFNALSSGAGRMTGIWGLDLSTPEEFGTGKGKEASVGAILYVPN